MASNCRGLEHSTIALILDDARDFLATLEAAGLDGAAGRMADVVDALVEAWAEATAAPPGPAFFAGD